MVAFTNTFDVWVVRFWTCCFSNVLEIWLNHGLRTVGFHNSQVLFFLFVYISSTGRGSHFRHRWKALGTASGTRYGEYISSHWCGKGITTKFISIWMNLGIIRDVLDCSQVHQDGPWLQTLWWNVFPLHVSHLSLVRCFMSRLSHLFFVSCQVGSWTCHVKSDKWHVLGPWPYSVVTCRWAAVFLKLAVDILHDGWCVWSAEPSPSDVYKSYSYLTRCIQARGG